MDVRYAGDDGVPDLALIDEDSRSGPLLRPRIGPLQPRNPAICGECLLTSPASRGPGNPL